VTAAGSGAPCTLHSASLTAVIKHPRGPFTAGDQVQLTDPKGRQHRLVLAPGRSFHTHRGALAHDDLIGKPEGSLVTSAGSSVAPGTNTVGILTVSNTITLGGTTFMDLDQNNKTQIT